MNAPEHHPAASAERGDAPRLHILMRRDAPALNAGKAMAQAAHAANQCVHDARAAMARGDDPIRQLGLAVDLRDWTAETGAGVGTTLVHAVTEAEMRAAVEEARATGLLAGIVHDPSYPAATPAAAGETNMLVFGFAVAVLLLATGQFLGALTVTFAAVVYLLAITGAAQGASATPLDTRAYVFGPATEARVVVDKFPLHP